MATIYDVARLARVSTTTVSKVLSNTPYVSARTRQRVLDAMQQLHYSPRLAARGLTNHRTYVLGLIVPRDPDASFHDPFVMEIFYGVEAIAIENDYNVLVSTAKKPDMRSAYDRMLRTGYVDGVITVETLKGGIDDHGLEVRGIPRVAIGYREDTKEINAVHSDDRLGGYLAMKHLLSLGHRRAGIISGPADFLGAMDARLQGAQAACEEAGINFDPQLLTYGDFSIEGGYQAARPLFEVQQRPTAIFAMNDRMALGVMQYASDQGLHVPEDLSVVGFDDVALTVEAEPPLTTIRQFPAEIGKVATQHLFALINGEMAQFDAVVLPLELVVRDSTAPFSQREPHRPLT